MKPPIKTEVKTEVKVETPDGFPTNNGGTASTAAAAAAASGIIAPPRPTGKEEDYDSSATVRERQSYSMNRFLTRLFFSR